MTDATLNSVRPPAVAGAFYPGTVEGLRSQLSVLLASARATDLRRPKALIAPHAGYVYSGSIAASAYARLAPHRDEYSRVVLLGPAHRVRLRGLALPETTTFVTPLGEISLDHDAVVALRGLPQVCVSDEAHALEHSLEVHLPFLQQTLAAFTLVPLAVGDASVQEVGEVLDLLWGGNETLIVVSSDLSHYLPYSQARLVDEHTTRMILELAPRLNHEQACGATPVNGLLHTAGRRGLRPELLDLRNSGDTAGDRSRVVGYASFAFYDDVQANARAAAFQDPRFEPLRFEELSITQVEVSVLSTRQPIPFIDEEDALAQLRPCIDGIVLEFGRHRSTFLPQVWDSLPEPRRFLAELKRKAGLAPASCVSASTTAWC